jgi:hypothetical protein
MMDLAKQAIGSDDRRWRSAPSPRVGHDRVALLVREAGATARALAAELLAVEGVGDEGVQLRIVVERCRPAGTGLAELSTLPPALPPSPNAFLREGDSWAVTFCGETVRLKDTKGMSDIAHLLARPYDLVAAIDLVARAEGGALPSPEGADELLDARARAEYRERLRVLEAELDRAEPGPGATTLLEERDLLARELRKALGLGGRSRRTAHAAERARKAASWRIRDAVRRVRQVHPKLGRHLDRSIRLGTLCVYAPETQTEWRSG